MPLHIALLSEDGLDNSVVVDSDTGNVLYNIETPSDGDKRKTTIRDAQGQKVAHYRSTRVWGHDEVELRGQTMDLSDWLSKGPGIFSGNSRIFVAPDGKEYLWEKTWGKNEYELVDRQTGKLVARSYESSTGLFSRSNRVELEISLRLVPILDAIILSYIGCKRIRRRQGAAVAAAVAAGGGSSAGC